MGEGICLQCKKTKHTHYINKSFVKYLNTIITSIDLENQFEDFMLGKMGFCDCKDLSWMLSDQIDSNKIFEMVDKHNDPIPVFIADNIHMPSHCRPLPLERLNMFGELIGFLKTADRGIMIR